MPSLATHDPLSGSEIGTQKKIIQTFCWRGSQSEYLMGKFSQRFATLMVEDIVSVTQSESDGKVCITLFYR